MTVVGGYTALSTKGVASLLSFTLWRALTFPVTYLLVAILVATALLQIRYVNKALQRFDSTQVIPAQFVLFTISVIVGSAILYRDFESATAERVGKFVGGCALTFGGVFLITSGRPSGAVDHGEEDIDEEATIGLIDEESIQNVTESAEGESVLATLQKPCSSSSPKGECETGHRSPWKRPAHDASISSPADGSRTSILSARSGTTSTFDLVEPGADVTSSKRQETWLTAQNCSLEDEASSNKQAVQRRASAPPLPLDTEDLVCPTTPQRQTNLFTSPPKSDRPSTVTRRSIARITPGPLASPLSSSLSAIVAESLRRGVDTSSPRRRPHLGVLQRAKSQLPEDISPHLNTGEGSQGSPALRSTTQPSNLTGSDDYKRSSYRARLGSLGSTLNEFFWPNDDVRQSE